MMEGLKAGRRAAPSIFISTYTSTSSSGVACPSLSLPPNHLTPPPQPTNPKKGTDEFCGFENVEPEEKPSTYTRRRTFLLKWVGVLLQLAALFAVPVLAGVCYRDLDRCRAIGILDFYKF